MVLGTTELPYQVVGSVKATDDLPIFEHPLSSRVTTNVLSGNRGLKMLIFANVFWNLGWYLSFPLSSSIPFFLHTNSYSLSTIPHPIPLYTTLTLIDHVWFTLYYESGSFG
jgi:hypothetical protein